ncbi:hypothetical protein ABZ611_27470 [Streptomyces sp. NPDC007861]|uniref:hypothetical protein n=1 Tax=Streptomyces sp. NPDC007861 TaxID=3154893 RepID=UPI0033F86A8C
MGRCTPGVPVAVVASHRDAEGSSWTRAPLRHDVPGFAWAFAQEVRRCYPFVPFVGGIAVRDLEWNGTRLPEGCLVLLDLYGQDHDPDLWSSRTASTRSAGVTSVRATVPGEDITVAVLAAFSTEPAGVDQDAPEQDVAILLGRIPLPRSGVVLGPAPRALRPSRRRCAARCSGAR